MHVCSRISILINTQSCNYATEIFKFQFDLINFNTNILKK
jgi:hypothetical protein